MPPQGRDENNAENRAAPAVNGSVETLEADRNAPPQQVVRRGGTFESFRHRDFSWFWSGSLVSNTGSWMQMAALAIVVYQLRRSEIDLGLVNFASGIPVLFLALPAGLLADRVDKRKLLIWSQALLGVLAAALWALYRLDRLNSAHAIEALLWISVIGVLGGVLSALTFPAWQSFLPDLVPQGGLMNAIALNSAQFQASRMLGPLAASAAFAVGLTTGDVFLVNAASFLFVIAALWAIRPHPHAAAATDRRAPEQHESSWQRLTAGVRYAREHRVVGTLILSTAFMTVFGMPYMMLLPAIADKALNGPNHGQQYYTLLLAANGFGAIFGSLAVASLRPTVKRERLIPASILAMAALLIAFALSRWLPLSIALSTLAGAAFLTTNSLTNTSIQAAVPGQLRGRVMALFVMSFMGIMPISSALFGPLGEWIGPTNAVLGGAVLLGIWGLYLLFSRALQREDAPDAPA